MRRLSALVKFLPPKLLQKFSHHRAKKSLRILAPKLYQILSCPDHSPFAASRLSDARLYHQVTALHELNQLPLFEVFDLAKIGFPRLQEKLLQVGLYFAQARQDVELLEGFISRGAIINCQSHMSQSSLLALAVENVMPQVTAGETQPLNEFCQEEASCALRFVEAMLALGADPNFLPPRTAIDPPAVLPLLHALSSAHLPAVSLLLDHGAARGLEDVNHAYQLQFALFSFDNAEFRPESTAKVLAELLRRLWLPHEVAGPASARLQPILRCARLQLITCLSLLWPALGEDRYAQTVFGANVLHCLITDMTIPAFCLPKEMLDDQRLWEMRNGLGQTPEELFLELGQSVPSAVYDSWKSLVHQRVMARSISLTVTVEGARQRI
jgi:ankyrin repeat protein